MAEDAKRVPFEIDLLAQIAKEHHVKWTTPDGDAHDEIDKAVKEVDARLSFRYHGVDKQFWVCIDLHGYTGLGFPLFPCGSFPECGEVVRELHRRDLQGRARQVAAEKVEELQKLRAQQSEEMGEQAMPEIGPVTRALLKKDDPWARRQLAQDIARDMRRVFHRRPTAESGGEAA